MERSGSQQDDKRLGVALITAIVVAPVVFAWLTLKPGYSRRTRILAVGYAGAMIVGTISTIVLFFLMAGHIAAGEKSFDDFRVKQQRTSEAALRNSTDPNGPQPGGMSRP
jgi:hypothetical protein